MADFGSWKKYPEIGQEGEDSYRLDHPHFQNVSRVTYAKGVITDFKKISSDPFRVESMIKVMIEGYGESDYIPLFYHPKKDYWDVEEIKSQDFDEDQECHKLACLSFRGGDEVVVVMEAESGQLKPKYVLGFIDNFPRIGENIFKIEYDTQFRYIQCWPYDFYGNLNEEKNGPDDVPLNLLVEGETVFDDTQEERDEMPTILAPNLTKYCVQCNEPYMERSSLPHQNYYDATCHLQTPPYGYECDSYYAEVWEKWYCAIEYRVVDIVFSVGPILYMLCFLLRDQDRLYDWLLGIWDGCGHINFYRQETTCNWTFNYWGGDPPMPEKPNGIPDSLTNFGSDGDEDALKGLHNTLDCRLKAGLYTPELYESVKGGPTNTVSPLVAKDIHFADEEADWTNQYDGMVNQKNVPDYFKFLVGYQSFDEFKVYVRPHSKKEIVDAGWMDEQSNLPEVE